MIRSTISERQAVVWAYGRPLGPRQRPRMFITAVLSNDSRKHGILEVVRNNSYIGERESEWSSGVADVVSAPLPRLCRSPEYLITDSAKDTSIPTGDH